MKIKKIEEGLVYYENVKRHICDKIKYIYKSRPEFLIDIIRILQLKFDCKNEDLVDFYDYFWIWLEKVNYEEIYFVPVHISFHMLKSLDFHEKDTDKFKRRIIFEFVNQMLIEYRIFGEIEVIKNQYQDYLLRSNIYTKMCLSLYQEYLKNSYFEKYELRYHNIEEYYEKNIKKYESLLSSNNSF